MALTNYWWLLIWLFVGGTILKRVFPLQTEYVLGKKEVRWKMTSAIIMVVPYILWTAFRTDVFGDTGLYRMSYFELSTNLSNIHVFWTEDIKDPGFSVLSVIIKTIIGNNAVVFFLIIAVFQMLCLVTIYRKYSSNFWMSIFLFVVSTDYLSWMHNGMRQFIAVTAIFVCFHWLIEKKYIPLILVILLVSTIHGSAILMLPIIFVIQGRAWGWKNLIVIGVATLIVVFNDQFLPVLEKVLIDTQYDDIMTNEIWTVDNGTNIIRVLIYSIPAILAFLGRKYVREADDPVINICVNGSVISMAFYIIASVTSGIYVGRLPIYTGLMSYIALPWLIDNIFDFRSARLINGLMIIFYLVFFYFQMHFGWGLL